MNAHKIDTIPGDPILARRAARAEVEAGSNAAIRRRRSLVVTDESARHPFRATLNPRVKRDLHAIPAEDLWRLTLQDARGFASVYVAATAAILAFIV